jgi:Beta-L-arabinofuranosidase, GH127
MSDTAEPIPATLLLEERAGLAMNAVAGLADPKWDTPFFSADLTAHPARLRHGDWDYGSSHGRLTDASVLARHMSGVEEYAAAEDRYKQGLMGCLAADGLAYRRRNPKGHWEPNANLIDQRAVILALTTWYLDSGDPDVKHAADRHVAALHRIAIKEPDAWYYPASEYTPGGWPSANAIQLHLAPDPASFCGRLIMPLLRYHQATGNELAIELCEWFSKLIVERSGVFNADGSFNDALAYRSGHFHTRLGTLDGLARLALHQSDHALTAFVRRSYDWARAQGTRFGWTPGDLSHQRFEHETCSLVDMVSVGTALARAGYDEYWGVVERYVRNHLAQSQLLDVSWVDQADGSPSDEVGWTSTDRAGDRVLGAFAGYGAPNDYVADFPLGRGHTSDVQACCVGSGIRGLFTAWNHIVTGDERQLAVNLLLSRGGTLLDVTSHLPYTGRVDLTAHADVAEIRVRIPEWAGYAGVRVARQGPDGHPTDPDAPAWSPDDRVALRDVRAGETVSVTFPMVQAETDEVAAGNHYRTGWRGDDVVTIDPPGRYRPMYPARDLPASAPTRSWRYWVPKEEWAW